MPKPFNPNPKLASWVRHGSPPYFDGGYPLGGRPTAGANPANIGLEFVGGYRVPSLNSIGTPNMRYVRGTGDLLPGTGRWVFGHPADYAVELSEPAGGMGIGPVNAWPELAHEASYPIPETQESNDKNYSAAATAWLDSDTLLFSGRKSYRSGYGSGEWIGTYKISTGAVTRYRVASLADEEVDNFELMMGLGSGFVRLQNDSYCTTNFPGQTHLLGRGGYDVLGSPLGFGMAEWSLGDSGVTWLAHHVVSSPLERDPYYTFPAQQLGANAKLQMWKGPVGGTGYWIAGDSSGLAYVSDNTHGNFFIGIQSCWRGVIDYRAQGDPGTGDHFGVADPTLFYSDTAKGPDFNYRGDHHLETENQSYANGLKSFVVHVMDPAHVAEVKAGTRNKEDVPTQRFEFPRTGMDLWMDDVLAGWEKSLVLYMAGWDHDRQLLWVYAGHPERALMAFRITDGSNNDPILIPSGYGWT